MKPGDIVTIKCPDYRNEVAVVSHETKNMLGMRLIIVHPIWGNMLRELCFYPSELIVKQAL